MNRMFLEKTQLRYGLLVILINAKQKTHGITIKEQEITSTNKKWD